VTYVGQKLVETIHSIPKGSRLLVIDNSIHEKSLSWAWNYGADCLLHEEGYDVVVMMNDDIVLLPDTGELLANALLDWQFTQDRECKDRQLLLVSGRNISHMGVSPSDPPVYTALDLKQDYEQAELDRIERFHNGEYVRKFIPRFGTGPDYSCFAIGKSYFEIVGRFDEEFPWCYEDNDSHHRVRMAGFEAMSYAPYFHYGAMSIKYGGHITDIARQKADISKDRYIQKWGGIPGNEQYAEAFGVKLLARTS
jgi:hypothetical protein